MKTTPEKDEVRSGTYRMFSFRDLKPNPQNPRRMFDRDPLKVLEDSIRNNGILVPLTVYIEPRTQQHYILDGERRWRCAEAIETDQNEPKKVPIPANVVDPPNRVANILWMFNIHNLREQWELMPTALSLEVLMKDLGETDDETLAELTKVSLPQIKRCKVLLSFDKKYQAMMMDPNPEKRIKANFFIELQPVLDLYMGLPKQDRAGKTRDELIQHFLGLYQSRRIPSVIHFRRILEAHDFTKEDGRTEEAKHEKFLSAARELVTSQRGSIRKLFDPLTSEDKSVESAKALCEGFVGDMKKLPVEHVVNRAQLRRALAAVKEYVTALLTKLEG